MRPMDAADFDFVPLRRIGWPWAGPAEDGRWQAVFAAHPGARTARVSEQHRTGYVLADAPEAGFRAESPPEWQRRPVFTADGVPLHERAAVGDWVLHDGRRILALLPRRSAIKRAAAGEHYQQQVIAANVDTAFVVCGLDADFNPRRIERYLLLVGGGGVQPVVVLTKADREGTDAGAALAALAGLRAQGVPVLALNAKDPEAVAALAQWLQPGMSAVLVGSSGAGKSTQTNSMLGEQRMKTAEVREHDSRGRHTTTHRALIMLPSGGCLIDTPGMREIKLTGEEVIDGEQYADIDALADGCRFGDCSHQSEPGCAVRTALDDGRLDAERWQNYQKLRDELAAAADSLEAQMRRKSESRVLTKALNKRLGEKYGQR